MKTVKTVSVVSTKPISLSNAAKYISRFASSDHGASHAVTIYLQRASDSFNSLVQFQKKLKGGSHSSRDDEQKNPHGENMKKSEKKGKGVRNDVPGEVMQVDGAIEDVKIKESKEKNLQIEGILDGAVDEKNPHGEKMKKSERKGEKQEDGAIEEVKIREKKGKDEKNLQIEGVLDAVVEEKKKKKKKSGVEKGKIEDNVGEDGDEKVLGEVEEKKGQEIVEKREKKKKHVTAKDEVSDKIEEEIGEMMDGGGERKREKKKKKKERKENENKEAERQMIREVDGGENVDLKQRNVEGKGEVERGEEEGSVEIRDKKKKKKRKTREGEEDNGKKMMNGEVDGGETIDPAEQSGKKKKKRRKIEEDGK